MKYFKQIEKSSHFTNFGPKVGQLEHEISKIFDVSEMHVATLANATLAIEGALVTETESNLWTVPAWTFIAPVASLLRVQKNFMFVDTDSNWRTIGLNQKFNNDAILDVLPFGEKIEISRFLDFKGTILIDAAGTFDGLRNFRFPDNQRIGIVMSFHATKSLPGAEGGAFISNDLDWVKKVKQWSNFGFNQDRHATILGTNAKMHEYSAAIILASLSNWDKDKKSWAENNNWALSISKKYNLGVNTALSNGVVTPYWLINTKKITIEKIEKFMSVNGIQSRRWWGNGCHNLQIFKDVKIDEGGLIKTEELSSETLGFPMFRDMSKEQKTVIGQKFDEFFKVYA
jgi:dTDP-4-amino-4,6-dideoxygalactose transaminase